MKLDELFLVAAAMVATITTTSFVVAVDAYTINSQDVRLVGSATVDGHGKGTAFWRPTGAIAFQEGFGAVGILTAPPNCASAECAPVHTVAYTVNGGSSFSTVETTQPFCGNKGVVVDGKLRCPLEKKQSVTSASTIKVDVHRFEIVSSFFSKTFQEQAMGSEEAMLFDVAEDIVGGGSVSSIAFTGNAVQHALNGKTVYLLNADVAISSQENTEDTPNPGSTVVRHVLFVSADSYSWISVSSPLSISPSSERGEVLLSVVGDKQLQITYGKHDNDSKATTYWKKTTTDFGKTWSRASRASELASLPAAAVTTKYYTVLHGGTSAGIKGMTFNGPFTKSKTLSFARLHNRLVEKGSVAPATKVKPFDDAFANLTSQDCAPGAKSAPLCDASTSSVVAVTSFQPGYITVFYDQILTQSSNGNAVEYSVYAMKLAVNETKEEKDYKDRAAKAKRDAQREKDLEEARAKAKIEAAERRAREKLEKKRREEERQEQFAASDAIFVAHAESMRAIDDEMIVVRDVHVNFVSLEKKTFFMPPAVSPESA